MCLVLHNSVYEKKYAGKWDNEAGLVRTDVAKDEV